MARNLQKDILRVLAVSGRHLLLKEVKESLQETFGYEEEIQNHLDIFSSCIQLEVDALSEDEHVIKREGFSGGHPVIRQTFVGISNKGRVRIAPWYKKIWQFFTNDMAKILSILATALSVVSLSVSLLSGRA